ncbi:hypothetical protein [uncultured Microbulbifer sp.]|uniref:hypothetical protein n=1 Tax=uncultured Microbulbifer sp. TaxID=348147 RepID=UPI0026042084|nr:hypothetical protein [uncultured Microbulbifer sp.]
MSIYASFFAVLVVSLISVTLPHWSMFRRQSHPPILSVSAGIGVSYVFLALLPKLAEVQKSLQVDESTSLLPVNLHAYLGALAGFVTFLLIANRDMAEGAKTAHERLTVSEVLILCVFGIYYAQVGFLLGEWPSNSWFGYLALVTAFSMHFVGINFHLWRRYPHRFPQLFRWVLSLCLFVGWLGSVVAEELAGAVKFSTMFVAGGIIITAIREEIPPREDASVPAFLISVFAAAAFVLFAEVVLLR